MLVLDAFLASVVCIAGSIVDGLSTSIVDCLSTYPFCPVDKVVC